MAQTVSNDALWEKLSEIDRKFDKCIVMQESQAAVQEQDGNTPNLEEVKDTIIAEIRQQTALLDRRNDDHFGTNTQNMEVLNKNLLSAVKYSRETKEQLKMDMESLKKNKESYFNFRLFKIRKTSLLIVILGLLVFILTLFSMKQQNDYALLLEEYYRQGVVIEQQKDDIKTKTE